MVGRRPTQPLALLAAVKFGFVFLVGASAALMAVMGDASLRAVGVAGGAGLVFGLVVVWVAFPAVPDPDDRRDGPDW